MVEPVNRGTNEGSFSTRREPDVVFDAIPHGAAHLDIRLGRRERQGLHRPHERSELFLADLARLQVPVHPRLILSRKRSEDVILKQLFGVAVRAYIER